MMIRSLVAQWVLISAGAVTVFACGDAKPTAKDGGIGGRGGSALADDGGFGGAGGEAAGGGAGAGGVAAGGAGGVGAVGAGGAGAQGGRVVTWDPHDCHVSAVPAPSDPATLTAWSAARAYCESLSKQGCFVDGILVSVPVSCSDADRVEACVAQVLWTYPGTMASPCEDAWLKDLACAAASSFEPPFCEGANILGYPYGPPSSCALENNALVTCAEKNSRWVHVKGTYADCSYAPTSEPNCAVSCEFGGNDAALTCTGGAGLPKQCGCAVNGHVIYGPDPIFVRDCEDAARQAADGLCTSILDCCIKYVDAGQEVCACRDPRTFGYDSCQAMAKVAQGQIVDICPQLAFDHGACWPPGACQSPKSDLNP